jgi:galactose mutarotase-like enzyme
MGYFGDGPRIGNEFTYRGVEAAFIENEHLRVLVLPGKGGDVLEVRDKRRDVNVLWDAPHEWVPPGESPLPSDHATTWQTEHYPGGWQVNLPIAGYGMEIPGSAYGLHGESALLPFEATVREDDDEVGLELSADLFRYPFSVERELALRAGESALRVSETVTNEGRRELEYVWQHHLALGRPLIGPGARLDVPASDALTEEYGDDWSNNRLAGGESFEWPEAPAADGGTVDLSESFPATDAEIHDQAYVTGLDEGWYAVTNPDLDVGLAVSFPTDPFESLWYWQPFGGFDEAPFYGRNYNVGLEPTTAYPGGDLPEAQRENGTMKTLAPGESVSADLVARTYTGYQSVSAVDGDGVSGTTR